MVRHKLAEKSDKFHSASCAPIRQLASHHMAVVNSEVPKEESQTIKEFFEQTYLPWVEKNKRNSTYFSYRQIWDQHLSSHVGSKRLSDYKTSDASKFLGHLSEKYNRNTVAHVRSSLSVIFSIAVNLGLIDRNPVSEARSMVTAKPPAETCSYSLREVEDTRLRMSP
jgi:Phage integrase, N-terminal SAM-like domain